MGAFKPALFTEEDLVVDLAGRLDGQRGEKGRLAAQLGISRAELADVLGGRAGVRPGIAAELGFRKVVRFEPIA
jgi:hypothetical protein